MKSLQVTCITSRGLHLSHSQPAAVYVGDRCRVVMLLLLKSTLIFRGLICLDEDVVIACLQREEEKAAIKRARSWQSRVRKASEKAIAFVARLASQLKSAAHCSVSPCTGATVGLFTARLR